VILASPYSFLFSDRKLYQKRFKARSSERAMITLSRLLFSMYGALRGVWPVFLLPGDLSLRSLDVMG